MSSIQSSITDDQVSHSPDSLFSVDLSETSSSEQLHRPTNQVSSIKHESIKYRPSINELSDLKPARLLHTNLSIVPFEPVPGLYYLPNLIDYKKENEFLTEISDLGFFNDQLNNQMMFFSSLSHPSSPFAPSEADHLDVMLEPTHAFMKWPKFLVELIHRLPPLLRSVNPGNLDNINDLFFGSEKLHRPWQVIINLYKPSQGIEQHVDLVERFDEIILGISLGSNVAIQFEPVDPHGANAIERLYLEQRSGYIISRDARYRWTHGILANQPYDWVLDYASNETRKILRTRTRISITIRRLKADADLLRD